ncbi:MAG: 1-acyl-sn-glycerol-3-phosphate acyltransferase [Caldilineaceae bacterium]|nr:1-acyl-sn-glycerol-3-phosphate acyltransferase [Caldilineaceae bacterium]
MKWLLGVTRATLVLIVLVVGCLLIVAVAPFGLKRKGIPLANWIPVGMGRLVMLFFNIKLICPERDRFYGHDGFLAPNHVSFVDIVVLAALLPVRFLAAVEVKQRPVLGWAAAAAGTVFVDRSDIRSRREALVRIEEAYASNHQPPIVVFPEGRLGTGTELSNFQLGMFKLAKTQRIAYMPVAIDYDRLDIAVWHGRAGETLLQAGWKLATFRGPLRVTVTPLPVVHPTPDDNAAQLADAAHDQIAALLGLPPVETGR